MTVDDNDSCSLSEHKVNTMILVVNNGLKKKRKMVRDGSGTN